MMAFPAALWPVTMRRNGALISFSKQFDADLVSAAWGSRQRARCLGMHPHHSGVQPPGFARDHATLGRNPEIAHDGCRSAHAPHGPRLRRSMDESQVKLGARRPVQVPHRLKVGGIVAVGRNRYVYSAHRIFELAMMRLASSTALARSVGSTKCSASISP